MYHKESYPFYNSKAWLVLADGRKQADSYLCCDCMERKKAGGYGRVRDAEVVHHVIPRSERPDLELDIDNLRSLCKICHNRRHPEKGGNPARVPQPTPRARVMKI